MPLGASHNLRPHLAPSETPALTTFSYDWASRPTQITPPGSAGSYQFGYTGNVTLATDPAGKQRRSTTDALGRLIQVDEPGWGPATSGSGTISITGNEQWTCKNNNFTATSGGASPSLSSPCSPPAIQVFDSGTVSVTVGTYTARASYGQGSSTSTVASALNNSLNLSSSPVTATLSGSSISMVAKATGSNTNYTVSISTSYDSLDFSRPSFSGYPNPTALQGGTDANTLDTANLQHPFTTLYTYDPFDDLTQVSQGVQLRTYAYDGLQRLTSSTTPEVGNATYTYTDFGQILSMTDARGMITNYGYDSLNRLSQVSYNVGSSGVPATSRVTLTYDQGGAAANAMGRLTTMTDGVGSESYTYNAMGLTTQIAKVISGTTYTLKYGYNLAGEATGLTYPSNRVVQQSFDSIGRLAQIQSQGVTYLTNISYNGASQPLGFTYGNGDTAAYSYNSRKQLASIAYKQGNNALFSLAYQYTSTPTSADNNGQIRLITDSLDSSKSTTYTYDPVGRLRTAVNGQWGFSWGYDRYGNRLNQTLTSGSGYQGSVTIDPATNRIAGSPYAFDATAT